MDRQAEGARIPPPDESDRKGWRQFRPLEVPARTGLHVELRPLRARDYESLQDVEADPLLAQQWRFRGSTPSPDAWAQVLWQGILAQFLVVDRADGRTVGLVSTYRVDFQNSHTFVAVTSLPQTQRSPVVFLGALLFLDYVFWTWPFRKIYFEVPEYNLPQFGSAVGRLLSEEGRLRDHIYFGGQYWDEVLLSITRDGWADVSQRLLAIEGIQPRVVAERDG